MNLAKIITLSRPFYEGNKDPSHDWAHIQRVIKTCTMLGEKEKANLDLLLPAACMHDLINLPKNHPQRSEASTMTGVKAQEILIECGYNEDEIEKIKLIIKEHSFSKGLKPSTKEAAILQDADRLDAIGSIGILRCATVSTQMGGAYYKADEPWGEERELDDKAYMLDHYQTKLYKLPEMMNTDEGKAEAKRRVLFMQSFVNQLKTEVDF